MSCRDSAVGRIAAGDLDVAYIDAGPPPASVSRETCPALAPLLLLHGAVQTGGIWRRQAETFAADRRVLAPDLRGHGATQGSVDGLTIERLARDQIAFLDALGIKRAVVCGVSLGGMVALDMAAAKPDRIVALVVADTPLALSLRAPVRRALEYLGPQRILPAAFALLGQRRTGRLGLAVARSFIGRRWVGTQAERVFLEGFGTMRPEAVVATYRAIVDADPPSIRRLAMPCLVILGRRDTSLIKEHAEVIARRIEDARIVRLDAGHVANLDDPEGFNAAMAAFLREKVDLSD